MLNTRFKSYYIGLAVFTLVVLFENCSDTGFRSISSTINSNGSGNGGQDILTKYLGLYSPIFDRGQPKSYRIQDNLVGIRYAQLFDVGTKTFYTADNGKSGPEIGYYDSAKKMSYQIESIAGPQGIRMGAYYVGENALAYSSQISDVVIGGAGYSEYHDKLYFQNAGNPATLVAEFNPSQGQMLSSVVVARDELFFTQLSNLNGAGQGQCATYKVGALGKVLLSNSICGSFYLAKYINNKLIFLGRPSYNALTNAVYSYDGVQIAVVKDLGQGSTSSILYSDSSAIYFTRIEAGSCIIYKNDGTDAGTVQLYVNTGNNLCFASNLEIIKVGTMLFGLNSGRLVSVNSAGVATVLRNSGVAMILGQVKDRIVFYNSAGGFSSSDGTAAGTTDYPSGYTVLGYSSENRPAVIGSKFFFRAANSSFKSVLIQINVDTQQITEVDLDITSQPVVAGGKIYYGTVAPDPNKTNLYSNNSTSLKVTDGTPAGTSLIGNINSPIYGIHGTGTEAFFIAREPSSQRQVLWSINPSSNIALPLNGFAVPMTPNPTPSGQFLDLQFSRYLGLANNRRFYYINGNLVSIHQSTGEEVNLGSFQFSYNGEEIAQRRVKAVLNNFFFQRSTVGGAEFWKTDGTIAGTIRVNIETAAGFTPTFLTFNQAVNGKLILSASNDTQGALLATDGSAAGTVKLLNLDGGATSNFTLINNTLYFYYYRINGGVVIDKTIAKTDGTLNGTANVLGINSNFLGFDKFGSNLIYSVTNAAGAGQIWLLYTNNGATLKLSEITNAVFFVGSQSNGQYGIAHGNSQSYFSQIGTKAFFVSKPVATTSPSQLWVTDGTAAGTTSIFSSNGAISNLQAADNKIFFYNQLNTTKMAFDLHASDGTTAGTKLVINNIEQLKEGSTFDLNSGFGYPHFRVKNGKAYFPYSDPNNGTELWESDGTTANTRLSIDLNPGPESSNPTFLNPIESENLIYLRTNTFDRKVFLMP